jgi:hypothetical protein
MMVMTEGLTPQKILNLIETLTRHDQQWIMRQLGQSLGQAAPLPVPTALEETLTLGDAERDRLLALLESPPAPSETTKAAMCKYLQGGSQ